MQKTLPVTYPLPFHLHNASKGRSLSCISEPLPAYLTISGNTEHIHPEGNSILQPVSARGEVKMLTIDRHFKTHHT